MVILSCLLLCIQWYKGDKPLQETLVQINWCCLSLQLYIICHSGSSSMINLVRIARHIRHFVPKTLPHFKSHLCECLVKCKKELSVSFCWGENKCFAVHHQAKRGDFIKTGVLLNFMEVWYCACLPMHHIPQNFNFILL